MMFKSLLLSLMPLVSLALGKGATKVASGTGCTIAPQATNALNEGFRVKLYDYPLWDWIDFDCDKWVANSYTTGDIYSTIYGVNAPNFSFEFDLGKKLSTTLFGVEIKYNHFLAEYTGYFLAPEDGMYTLEIDEMDDGAMVWFGEESAFNCCGPQLGIPNDSHLNHLFRATNRWGNDENHLDKGFLFLKKGIYYPMRVVYMNVGESAVFHMKMTTPSGIEMESFEGYIYNADRLDNGICHSEVPSYDFNIIETKTVTGATSATTRFSERTEIVQGATNVWVQEIVFAT